MVLAYKERAGNHAKQNVSDVAYFRFANRNLLEQGWTERGIPVGYGVAVSFISIGQRLQRPSLAGPVSVARKSSGAGSFAPEHLGKNRRGEIVTLRGRKSHWKTRFTKKTMKR